MFKTPTLFHDLGDFWTEASTSTGGPPVLQAFQGDCDEKCKRREIEGNPFDGYENHVVYMVNENAQRKANGQPLRRIFG
ncbi:MAG: hypothetical protein JWM96_348 [Alphaproteobacteria bacterium]|nr:hypothetical protein [Alphaproteobacteria bacterium]